VTLLREIDYTQDVDYQPLDAFPAETHEAALDKLTFLSQQLKEIIDRSVTLPLSAPEAASAVLPDPVADTLIGWNATGDALQNNPIPSAGIVTNGSITAAKLATSAVETVKINDDAVTTSKINDGAVTNPKLTRLSEVANHRRAGDMQVWDGSASPILFVPTTSIAVDTTESVGPTGSGADNIWTALDSLPSEARILMVDVLMHVVHDGVNDATGQFVVAAGDVTLSAGNNHIARTDLDINASGDMVTQLTRCFIPLGAANLDFQARWSEQNTTSVTITLFYRGFITD
jgi:hypothetical protein